jgi:hypothetical protein
MKFQLPLVTMCRQRDDRAGVRKKGNSYDTDPRTQSIRGTSTGGERNEVD